MKSIFLQRLLSFYAGLPLVFGFYLIFNDAFLYVYADLHDRFHLPATNSLSGYFSMFLIGDYTIYSLSLLTGYIGVIKHKVSNKQMLIAGILSAVFVVLSHQVLLSSERPFAYYTYIFPVFVIGFVGYFIKKGRKYVPNILILTTSVAYFVFLMMLHIVFVKGALYSLVDERKGLSESMYAVVVENIKRGNADIIEKAYADKFNHQNYQWVNDYPEFVAKDFSLYDVYEKMGNSNNWSFVFERQSMRRDADEDIIYSLGSMEGEQFIDVYELNIGSVQNYYSIFFKLIYTCLMCFTFVWMIGLFKLLGYHDKVVKK